MQSHNAVNNPGAAGWQCGGMRQVRGFPNATPVDKGLPSVENGVDMAGRMQSEAVKLLRETPQGGVVSLLVSRIVVEGDEEREVGSPNTQAAALRELVSSRKIHRAILTILLLFGVRNVVKYRTVIC